MSQRHRVNRTLASLLTRSAGLARPGYKSQQMRAYVLVPAILAGAVFATSCSKSNDSSAGSSATSAAATAAATDVATSASTDAPGAASAVPSAMASAAAAADTAAAAAAPGAASSTPAAAATVAASFSDIAGNINEPAILALGQLGVLDSTSGAFHPSDPIKRRDYVRWLFKTNNAVFAGASSKLIHPAGSDEDPAFSDLKSSDPDFQYVQGMSDSGVSVGFPDKTFKGDQPITREQAVAIKSILDSGGIDHYFSGANTAGFSYYTLPQWKDRKQVSVTYVGAIAQDIGTEGDGKDKVDNIGRTFGTIAVFRPQAKLTRGEAATMFQIIGGHSEQMMYENAARSVAAALHPASPAP